jgi:hypothetical protein
VVVDHELRAEFLHRLGVIAGNTARAHRSRARRELLAALVRLDALAHRAVRLGEI